MVVYIVRSPLAEDPRLQKYIEACRFTNTEYLILSWNRLCAKGNCDKNEVQFNRYMPYGCGRQNIVLLCQWSVFVVYNLLKRLLIFKVIHAVNFDSYILAYPFKIFGKKIIYDIYDNAAFKLERQLACKSDLLILPHKRRLDRMKLKENKVKNLLIVENIPVYKDRFPVKTKKLDTSHIHLSYVGSFEKNIRGIENILEIVEQDSRFILDIAGSGVGLDETIKEYSHKCPRIKFHGRVSYSEALKIMYNSDFIIAIYYLRAIPHIWVCPNKIYESLFLATPVITSMGTLVGKEVQECNTGYAIEDSQQSFLKIFCNYGTKDFIDDYKKKVSNCQNVWREKYNDYFIKNLAGKYISQVCALSH